MSEHALAVLRGWYPHWQAQMRTWNVETFLFYGVFLVAALATINSLRSR